MKFKFEVEVERETPRGPLLFSVDGQRVPVWDKQFPDSVPLLLIQKFHELRVGIDKSKVVKA